MKDSIVYLKRCKKHCELTVVVHYSAEVNAVITPNVWYLQLPCTNFGLVSCMEMDSGSSRVD